MNIAEPFLKDPNAPKLKFTGIDLIRAVITVGMPPAFLTPNHIYNRRNEIKMKLNMIEAFITENQNQLEIDHSKWQYLDATEKVAIDYWMGMFFINVFAQTKLNYSFLVHLSFVNKFCRIHNLPKIQGNFQPDLVGVKLSDNGIDINIGIFEAKGYQKYNKRAIDKAYAQIQSINQIAGIAPTERVAVMTLMNYHPAGIAMLINGLFKCNENHKPDLYYLVGILGLIHFRPIAELIAELHKKSEPACAEGIFEWNGFSYKVRLPKKLYQTILDFNPLLYGPEKADSEKLLKAIQDFGKMVEKNLEVLKESYIDLVSNE